MHKLIFGLLLSIPCIVLNIACSLFLMLVIAEVTIHTCIPFPILEFAQSSIFFWCMRVCLDVQPWASPPLSPLHKGQCTQWQPCLIGLKCSVTLKRCELQLGQRTKTAASVHTRPQVAPRCHPAVRRAPSSRLASRRKAQNAEGPRGMLAMLFCCPASAPPLHQARNWRASTALMLLWLKPTCVECLGVQGGTNCRVQTRQS